MTMDRFTARRNQKRYSSTASTKSNTSSTVGNQFSSVSSPAAEPVPSQAIEEEAAWVDLSRMQNKRPASRGFLGKLFRRGESKKKVQSEKPEEAIPAPPPPIATPKPVNKSKAALDLSRDATKVFGGLRREEAAFLKQVREAHENRQQESAPGSDNFVGSLLVFPTRQSESSTRRRRRVSLDNSFEDHNRSVNSLPVVGDQQHRLERRISNQSTPTYMGGRARDEDASEHSNMMKSIASGAFEDSSLARTITREEEENDIAAEQSDDDASYTLKTPRYPTFDDVEQDDELGVMPIEEEEESISSATDSLCSTVDTGFTGPTCIPLIGTNIVESDGNAHYIPAPASDRTPAPLPSMHPNLSEESVRMRSLMRGGERSRNLAVAPTSPNLREDFRIGDPHGVDASSSPVMALINNVPSARVEIAPGVTMPLRSSQETLMYVAENRTAVFDCFVCRNQWFCLQDAAYLLCPTCRVVSPADMDGNGVGMGFSAVDYSMMTNSYH